MSILPCIPPLIARCYRPANDIILMMELIPLDLHIGFIDGKHENFIYYYDKFLKRTFSLELIDPIGIGRFSFDFTVKPDCLLLNIYSKYHSHDLFPSCINVREIGLMAKEAMNYRNSIKAIL